MNCSELLFLSEGYMPGGGKKLDRRDARKRAIRMVALTGVKLRGRAI
jgi:hypothetical protein